MRVSLLTLTLAIVLAASALNLVLGALWVTSVIAILTLRRRVRLGAWLILLLVIGIGAAGVRFAWFAPPAPASYGTGEGAWLLARVRRTPATPATDDAAAVTAPLRARLRAQKREEFRYAASDFERRAAAAIALSRSLGALRVRAPEAAAALDVAVRRLALTLTSPEFQDLDGRRARLRAWFEALEVQLATARDEAEAEAVARALDPVAMASVSMRALREDLARVDEATVALVRALTGGGVSAASTLALQYDDRQGVMVTEDRYTVTADPPLRIVGLDVGLLRQQGEAVAEALIGETPEGTAREVRGRELAWPDGVARVVVVHRRARRAVLRSVQPLLRRVAFTRVAGPGAGDSRGEIWVTVAVDSLRGSALAPTALVAVETPPPRLERITAPRYSLFYVSQPGVITSGQAADEWVPATSVRADELFFETAPATALLRNRIFARLDPYLYVPNTTTLLAVIGLAALACVLMDRRRAAPPPPRG